VLTIVAGLYAGVALFLASLGLYGVLAHSVERRTQEIGIRRALGAPPASVLRLVVAEGLTPTLVGIGVGLLAAFLLTRAIASLLYGVGATDPGVFCGISGLLLGVAVAACWLPARRAIRVDPIVALRAP
jgi:ABC-type antimicrobial peptide transport system permease subunit